MNGDSRNFHQEYYITSEKAGAFSRTQIGRLHVNRSYDVKGTLSGMVSGYILRATGQDGSVPNTFILAVGNHGVIIDVRYK